MSIYRLCIFIMWYVVIKSRTSIHFYIHLLNTDDWFFKSKFRLMLFLALYVNKINHVLYLTIISACLLCIYKFSVEPERDCVNRLSLNLFFWYYGLIQCLKNVYYNICKTIFFSTVHLRWNDGLKAAIIP